MAVSNPATLKSVYAEFGAPNGTRLSAFLRGGQYVPNVPQNSNVPTSLPIRLQQLAGAVAYVNVTATKSSDAVGNEFRPEPAPASLQVTSNQVVITGHGGTGNYTCTWSHVSGSGGISTPGPNQFTVTFGGNVSKNTSISAVKRCTVSDGQSSGYVDVSVTLRYTTSI